MRKYLSLITVFFILHAALIIPVYAEPASPNIHAPAAILMDSSSGRILYGKNIHDKKFPASITKIMTAILALERGHLEDIVTASPAAIFSIERDSSNIGILIGEQMTLNDLLIGLLIASANDGANVIAEHIAGSTEEFIKLMNQRAKELGALNTQFTNANGLHHDIHYTTAYDVALIARYAMTIPKFREIVKLDCYEMEPTNKYKEKRYFANTNHLVNKYRATNGYNYFYAPAIGIKTGYTSQSNHTLAAAAKKENTELITVVLDAMLDASQYYSYIDTINLFEYGFKNFSKQTIVKAEDFIDEVMVNYAKKDQKYVILLADRDLSALLPNNINKESLQKDISVIPQIQAPIQKGEVLGSITYRYKDENNDSILGTVNLVADRNIEKEPLIVVKEKTISIVNSTWLKVTAAALGILIASIAIIKLIHKRKRKNQARFYSKKRRVIYINRKRKW